MRLRFKSRWVVVAVGALLLCFVATPWILRTYWNTRASNPVRRGLQRAQELGCFACHGELGRRGIPDPGVTGLEVPAWTPRPGAGPTRTDADLREIILHGSFPPHDDPAVEMPGYAAALGGSDLDDLVAAYRVLSGSSTPPAAAAAARRGHELALRWRCFACHGPAGSGGVPNPGSLTGLIPGWYGPEFEDLVRDRVEFDEWVLSGSLARLRERALPAFFLERQRLAMPAYTDLSSSDLADLWAYVEWLGHDGGTTSH